MRNDPAAVDHRGEHTISVKIMSPAECCKIVAALIAKHASEINRRRAGILADGTDAWQLAQSEIEDPLSCGILKKDDGCLVTLDSSSIGTSEIEVCAEPRRLILLGWHKATDRQDKRDPAVRVLTLPDEVKPSSMSIRQQGPILDTELHTALARKGTPSAPKAA